MTLGYVAGYPTESHSSEIFATGGHSAYDDRLMIGQTVLGWTREDENGEALIEINFHRSSASVAWFYSATIAEMRAVQRQAELNLPLEGESDGPRTGFFL